MKEYIGRPTAKEYQLQDTQSKRQWNEVGPPKEGKVFVNSAKSEHLRKQGKDSQTESDLGIFNHNESLWMSARCTVAREK